MTFEPQIEILKYSGEKDYFSEEKLRKSLESIGTKPEVVDDVISKVRDKLFNGITTKEIYKTAHQILKQKESIRASKYKLKQSILELGPTGYPFEIFVGELMKADGYHVQVGLNMQGRCVSHEVDILAENDQEVIMMECKFHNRPGYKSDVKVPLYINSRFHDLDQAWKQSGKFLNKSTQGYVVTNSRFTLDAITYGTCAGLGMLSWDFPNHKNLKSMVNHHLLYPITSLQSLTKRDAQLLISEGIIVTKHLCDHFEALDILRYPQSKLQKIITETNLLCEL